MESIFLLSIVPCCGRHCRGKEDTTRRAMLSMGQCAVLGPVPCTELLGVGPELTPRGPGMVVGPLQVLSAVPSYLSSFS